MCKKEELRFSIFMLYSLADKWKMSPARVYQWKRIACVRCLRYQLLHRDTNRLEDKLLRKIRESLVPLKQYKIDAIRSQERKDWFKQIIEGANIDNLDQGAIQLAREKYKEKMAQEPIPKEVDGMSDEQFLTKMKLLIGGKVTNAAMLLLGNSDFDYLQLLQVLCGACTVRME